MCTQEDFGHSYSLCLLDIFQDFPKIPFYFFKSVAKQVCEYSSSETRVFI